MTGKRFLKIREWIPALTAIAAIVTAFGTYAIIGWSEMHDRELDRHAFVALGFALVGTAMAMVLVALIGNLCRRWFIKRHPEMQYLDEWIEVMGSAEGYSCDPVSHATGVMGRRELIDLGKAVNYAIVAREIVKRERDEYAEGDPIWVLFNEAFDLLNFRVDEANDSYLHAWRLLVDGMKIVTGHKPQAYRELFL